ncbi:MAG TPA: GAF domain-containing protein [Streptosporangiaceae bacterium]
MPPEHGHADAAHEARQSAALERQRAAAAAARAARHEAMIAAARESLRPLHVRLAALQRRAERRHLAAAEMHSLLAGRLSHRQPGPDLVAPAVMEGVARALGTASALAVLRGRNSVATVGASDAMAQAAHDLETLMAEGPAIEAAIEGQPVIATGTQLPDRWPRYGPAARELGIAAVLAMPLGPPGARLGALCALDKVPVIREATALTLRGMSAALTQALLDRQDLSGRYDPLGAPAGSELMRLVHAVGSEAEFNQAIGMISVQCGCSVGAAADLLAARAFAEGVPAARIAAQVVRGETTLAD